MLHSPVPRRASSALSVLASVVLMAAAPFTPPERPEHWPRLALDTGTLYMWDRASAAMIPVPPGPIPAGSPPLVIADAGDGRGVLLARAASGEESHGRKRSEGEALLLAWGDLRAPDRGLTLAWTSRFEGLPRAAAVASSRAWVLTARAATSETVPERVWLHELDRTSGRIEDSTLLAAPAAALAADPLGRRVFLALEGRILSLTTRPLVTSWHYRSPGANRALAISSSGAVLASLRDRELALFDAAVMAHQPVEARRSLEDDATTVIPLPLDADGIAFSEDDRLLALFGKEGFAFVETATGALVLTGKGHAPAGAARLHPIDFPGADEDLVVAAFPAGEVVALPAPAMKAAARSEVAAIPPPPPEVTMREPIATTATAAPETGTPETAPPKAEAESAATLAAAPPPAPEEAAPTDAAPMGQAPTALETAPPPETAPARMADAAPPAAPAQAALPAPSAPTTEPTPAKEPATAPEPPPGAEPASAPGLSGRITGDRARVRAIVLYGPNSIIREHGRVTPDAAGAWLFPLPPAGTYRVVPVGDGSTPIPVAPAFLTIVVTTGERRAGLDFEVGAVR